MTELDPSIINENGHVILTAQEARAIRSLKRLASKWPDTLMLFSNSGTLEVLRLAEDGTTARVNGHGSDIDERALVAEVRIRNDGGDR